MKRKIPGVPETLKANGYSGKTWVRVRSPRRHVHEYEGTFGEGRRELHLAVMRHRDSLYGYFVTLADKTPVRVEYAPAALQPGDFALVDPPATNGPGFVTVWGAFPVGNKREPS